MLIRLSRRKIDSKENLPEPTTITIYAIDCLSTKGVVNIDFVYEGSFYKNRLNNNPDSDQKHYLDDLATKLAHLCGERPNPRLKKADHPSYKLSFDLPKDARERWRDKKVFNQDPSPRSLSEDEIVFFEAVFNYTLERLQNPAAEISAAVTEQYNEVMFPDEQDNSTSVQAARVIH